MATLAEQLPQEADNQLVKTISRDHLGRLGKKLRDRYAAYARDRQSLEQQWAKNLRQYLGEYDGGVQIEQGRSRAYPRITRVKVVSMVSRLMALLFPTGEDNWSLESSPSPDLDAEQLNNVLQEWAMEQPDAEVTDESLNQAVRSYAAKQTDNLRREITDQLKDTATHGAEGYEALVRKVVHSAVLYCMGVLKGPMTTERALSRIVIDEMGRPTVQTDVGFRPTFEFVPLWDYYPDLSATSFAQMDGQFQRRVFSRHQLTELAGRSDFFGDVIRDYVRDHRDGNYTKQGYENELQQIKGGSRDALGSRNKYEVLEWWGYVSGQDLHDAGIDVTDAELTRDMRATLWILDDVVIKAQRDPFPEGVRMYHQFVFEDDEVNLCGSGLPPIMRDSQLAVAAAARMLIDNAAAVCGPNLEVDLSLLEPGTDVATVRAFAVWYKKHEGGGGNTGRAIQSVSFDSHIPELSSIIRLFMDFADKETFVSPMTGGDMENAPSEPMRTASGASMILGATALPFRDIVRNFDQFTISVIHSLVAWNRLFNMDTRIVGDIRPIGRGATSLIAKEVRAFALDNMANTMREDEAMHIDSRELAKQRLLVRDLPLDQLMVPEAESQRRMQQAEEQRAAVAQQQQALFEKQTAQISADTFKAISQAQKNLDNGDVTVFKAILEAVAQGVDPDEIIRYISRNPTAVVSNQGQPGGAGTASISETPAGGGQGPVGLVAS